MGLGLGGHRNDDELECYVLAVVLGSSNKKVSYNLVNNLLFVAPVQTF